FVKKADSAFRNDRIYRSGKVKSGELGRDDCSGERYRNSVLKRSKKDSTESLTPTSFLGLFPGL
ncbi:MAG: hypothetical protein KDK08_29655, partial [Rhizobiaceae bacterium]|nr:hypothetical protein [Rhizobiaceae bacterium]